jgi:hypothetical protein
MTAISNPALFLIFCKVAIDNNQYLIDLIVKNFSFKGTKLAKIKEIILFFKRKV